MKLTLTILTAVILAAVAVTLVQRNREHARDRRHCFQQGKLALTQAHSLEATKKIDADVERCLAEVR